MYFDAFCMVLLPENAAKAADILQRSISKEAANAKGLSAWENIRRRLGILKHFDEPCAKRLAAKFAADYPSLRPFKTLLAQI
jgi:hypothetical protein